MIGLRFNAQRPLKKRVRTPKTTRTNAQVKTHHDWTDQQILACLDLAEIGQSRAEIARAINMAYGCNVSRMAVTGMLDRVKRETDAVGECFCEKPENKDGGMPEGWWRP